VGIQKTSSIVHLWHDIGYPKATPIKLRVKDRTSKILEHRRDNYYLKNAEINQQEMHKSSVGSD